MPRITVNGRPVDAPEGATLATAVIGAGALCALGGCTGCRVTGDGRPSPTLVEPYLPERFHA